MGKHGLTYQHRCLLSPFGLPLPRLAPACRPRNQKTLLGLGSRRLTSSKSQERQLRQGPLAFLGISRYSVDIFHPKKDGKA
jgi:hypothetical protein